MLRPGCQARCSYLWKVAGVVLKRTLWRLIQRVGAVVSVRWSPHLLDRSKGLGGHLSPTAVFFIYFS